MRVGVGRLQFRGLGERSHGLRRLALVEIILPLVCEPVNSSSCLARSRAAKQRHDSDHDG
jgi:hypothetical protein